MSNETVNEILGFPSQMLSSSKSAYASQYPDHTVFFNACIFNSKRQQIWWGDLDLTKDSAKLQNVANQIGTIYVTKEKPYRWDGLGDGKLEEFENLKIFNPTV